MHNLCPEALHPRGLADGGSEYSLFISIIIINNIIIISFAGPHKPIRLSPNLYSRPL